MTTLSYTPAFRKTMERMKDSATKERVKKHIEKITTDPEIGKPMRFSRKGTREVYIEPYRLAYQYVPEEDLVIMLELYHKDEQ